MKKNNLLIVIGLLLCSVFATAQKMKVPIKTAELKVPKIYLNFWNSKTSIQNHNNCYNYSTNRLTNDFAQPGDASRNIYTDLTCDDVSKSAASDLGLELTDFFDFKSADDLTLIALVVAPGSDFHWYRRDNNNMWSHKPGSTPATTLDNSDKAITNPETADRGPYTDFCGYFKIKNLPTTTHEQNAGQVRIGNMKNLPTDVQIKDTEPNPEKSYVELQKYSGRRNPRIYLDQILLALPQLKMESNLLNRSKHDIFKTTQTVQTAKSAKLGEQKFILNDVEGVFTEKNSATNINSYLSPEEILQLQKMFLGK